VATLKQIALGMTVAAASRQLGVSEQAIYRWKRQYVGLESDQVRELEILQEENARLKRLVADLSLDKAILRDINAENWPGTR
jgi:putative transposase